MLKEESLPMPFTIKTSKFPSNTNFGDNFQHLERKKNEISSNTQYPGNNIVAVFARIGDEIQWPLAKDEPVVKLDTSHYLFTLRVPSNGSFEEGKDSKGTEEVLNYGLTIAAKGQEGLLKELNRVLETYSCFSVQEVKGIGNWNIVDTRNL
ncbi:hypothetical protein COLO4_16704 [Corchorus olitorius]|uniref:Uncharacterized protein n=1 Tax=Corchorus olitorius TaxID=93759 RepID=A0A1R3JG22_9ROSI|nr:hypothetical protein COLO4_16704 [Corchorus olitorius]